MTLVVDASVAVKFIVREHDTDQARRVLEAPDALIAPDWLMIEAASTLWKKVKRSELLAIHAEDRIEMLPRFFSRLHPSADLAPEALKLGVRLRHSVYDCLYLALAIRMKVRVVTADAKFAEAATVGGLGEHVERLA